jgi:plasmid maintenance system antidote protein VapI
VRLYPPFLNEHSALSPETAIRIEKVFGVSIETLMRMQTSYIETVLGVKGPHERR